MRQPWPIRLTHWLNALLLLILIGSGLRIFNAHDALYAADASDPQRMLLHGEIPDFLTIGGWLAGARRWHLTLMWPFALNGLAYATFLFLSGEAKRRLIRRQDWRGIPAVVMHYMGARPLPEGEGYNSLQRLTYTLLLFALGPLVILTGFAMAPAADAFIPGLTEVFGGRQFARTWHFVIMASFVAFTLLHIGLVTLAGWPTMRSMLTGRAPEPAEAAHE